MNFPKCREIGEIAAGPAGRDEIEAALERREPFIARGLASSWPALRTWNRDTLVERLGELTLPAYEGVTGAFPDPRGMRRRTIRFGEYVDELWSGAMERPTLLEGDSALIYAGRRERDENFATLESDIERPWFIDRDDLRQIGFWLSCEGVSSWLHYDNNLLDNVNAQVKGSKRAVLFAPGEASRLGLNTYSGDGAQRAQFSGVDLREPDVERFPGLLEAEAWIGVLEEGDTLYIPSCWFHGFQHLHPINLNVNFWWRPAALPWNPITARRSLWQSVERMLGADDGDDRVPVERRLAELPEAARSVIERLELSALETPSGSQYP